MTIPHKAIEMLPQRHMSKSPPNESNSGLILWLIFNPYIQLLLNAQKGRFPDFLPLETKENGHFIGVVGPAGHSTKKSITI